MADKPNIGVEKMERSNSLNAAGSFLWRGPSFMSRMAGHEAPHEAPRATETKMRKVLGLFGLSMMSTAAIIGAGIFVLTGVVAKQAGPGVIISFLIGGIVAMLCAMAYMEFAAETRTAGASIVYTSKVFGKLVAWLVAINVLMELVIAAAAVAKGFSDYLAALIMSLDKAGPHLLKSWSGTFALKSPCCSIDLVAMAAVLIITLLLVIGIKEAEWLENICTSLCIFTIIMCIIVGAVLTRTSNFTPFAPNGFNGIFRGASMVFFAYLGFEMMATAPEESINPTRDVPLAIGISVGGCTILYLLMALVISGMLPYQEIAASAPFAAAFNARGAPWMAIIVGFGSVCGILDTIVVTQYSMSRTFVILGRMGLVPPVLSRVHPKTRTPVVSVLFCGAVSAVLALFVPLEELSDLTSMGALFAFCVVSAGVLFRRYYQPPGSHERQIRGMTGNQGKPLWLVLTLLLTIVGSSLGVAFGWATGCHYGVYAAFGALWFIATGVMWVFLPVVFKPRNMPCPLCPWWPSCGIFTTIFLIASLGPQNWARWGYGCAIGVALFGSFGICEYVYNRKHGPPASGSAQEAFDEDWCKGEEGQAGAATAAKSAGSKDIETGTSASQAAAT